MAPISKELRAKEAALSRDEAFKQACFDSVTGLFNLTGWAGFPANFKKYKAASHLYDLELINDFLGRKVGDQFIQSFTDAARYLEKRMELDIVLSHTRGAVFMSQDNDINKLRNYWIELGKNLKEVNLQIIGKNGAIYEEKGIEFIFGIGENDESANKQMLSAKKKSSVTNSWEELVNRIPEGAKPFRPAQTTYRGVVVWKPEWKQEERQTAWGGALGPTGSTNLNELNEGLREQLLNSYRPKLDNNYNCAICKTRGSLLSFHLLERSFAENESLPPGFMPMSKSNWVTAGVRISGVFPVCVKCAPVCNTCGLSMPTERVLEFGTENGAATGNGICNHFHFDFLVAVIFKRIFEVGRFGYKPSPGEYPLGKTPLVLELFLLPLIFIAGGSLIGLIIEKIFGNSSVGFFVLIAGIATVFFCWNPIKKRIRWILNGAGIPVSSKYHIGTQRLGHLFGLLFIAPLAVWIFWHSEIFDYDEILYKCFFAPSVGALAFLIGTIVIRALFWARDGFSLKDN